MVRSLPSRRTLALPISIRILAFGDLVLVAVKFFVLEEADRVVAADGALEQALGVVGKGGRDDGQRRDVGVPVFRRVGMGRADLQAAAGGTAKNDRNGELAARHVADLRGVVDDLVVGDERKTPGHELDHGPQAVHGRADGQAGETGFADRRVDDPLRAELLQQALADLVGAVVFGDFLAHEHDAVVALHFFGEGLIEGFAVGQGRHIDNLVSQCGRQ